MTEITHSQSSGTISKSRKLAVIIIGWIAFLVSIFGMIKGLVSSFPILWFAALITSFSGVVYYIRLKRRIGIDGARKISRIFTPYFMSTFIFFGFGVVLIIANFMNQ